MKKYLLEIFMTCLLFINFSWAKKTNLEHNIVYPQAKNTITCQLEHIARVKYESGKINKVAYTEKAKFPSVFTDLNKKNPKMIQPDQIDLIKINESDGVYWLGSIGSMGMTLFIVDTNNKLLIQQRSMSLGETTYGQSWLGKCL